MKIDINDTKSLKFVKVRVGQLMIGQTRRGRALVYKNAADSVLESLFGFRRLASHIGAAETKYDMQYIIRKVDAQALFEILRYKDSYSLLAKLIILKNKLDEGEIDSKDDRKKLSSAYKKAVKKLIHDYDIRNGHENDFNDILEFVGKSSDGFNSLFDDDDDDFIFNRGHRRRQDWGSLFELSDDDSGYRRDRDYDRYEDDVDEFERFLGATEPKKERRRRRKPEEMDFDEDIDDDDYDYDDMTEARMAAMETAINSVAKSVQTLSNTVSTAQMYHPASPPPPEPKREPKRREKPIGIPRAAPQPPQSIVDTAKIISAINKVSSEMSSFKEDTANCLSEAFTRIDTIADRIGVAFVEDDEETDAGTFVRSSTSPPDVTEEDIASSIDNAI